MSLKALLSHVLISTQIYAILTQNQNNEFIFLLSLAVYARLMSPILAEKYY